LTPILNEAKSTGGFTGTEYMYPILYAIKGLKDTSQIETDDTLVIEGRQHIDNLWKTEIKESMEPDKHKYFISDDSFRSLCVGLNEGANGWVLLVGQVNESILHTLLPKLKSKRLIPFVYGDNAVRLKKLDLVYRDLGPRESSIIYFAQLLVRYALIYARDIGGDPHEISHSIEEYAPGVVLLIGEPTTNELEIVQGLMGLGTPVIAMKKSHGLVGHIYTIQTFEEMVDKVWMLPNIRSRLLKRKEPNIPVASGPAYSREKLEDYRSVKSSNYGFISVILSEIEEDAVIIRGEIEKGTGFSVLVELGNSLISPDITLWVEAILQRVCKYAEGVKIVKTSDGIEYQKTEQAHDTGFNLEHFGELIITELRNEFPKIGPIQVSFILDLEIEKNLHQIISAHIQSRKEAVDSASEEETEIFYGCTRCRSFSLGHACTVTPDRPAQCSKPWYMLKAYATIAPENTYNPCTLIEKGECLDENLGEYVGVNESTRLQTGGEVSRVYLHSIFDFPHTACSCFQNVAYYVPEMDGIALMHRGYEGEAPGGMTWTRLANLVAGRQYSGGATPFATQYLRSPKFLKGDGGYERVVWMTKKLKDFAGEAIPENLFIATENDAITIGELACWRTSTH
jgi:acetyl-CoA decarbonylase/synthase complex subunit beta